jgi:membrane associated rhomboid family serine protease
MFGFLYMTVDSFVTHWEHIGGFLTGILQTKVSRKENFK